jgi:eukaryotic-like serine/threonine-protein kinase
MSESAHPESTTHTWQPGAVTLFDRYQLLGVLGQGGMGTVYKAYHLNLKRFVAIKVLRIDQIASLELKGRFLREMEAVGQMDHPNIVRASDAGKNNGVFYLVMEYLEGSDLSRLVTAHGPLSMADACELSRQAAVGLEYIHRTLVHRDIKPSNLILTMSGVLKILDLGLARLHEVGAGAEFTPTGSAVGTYDYLAPEQAVASSHIDGRADIYSLGCTLFKLLTGRPPFPGPDYDSAPQKLYAHSNIPLTAAPDFELVPEALRPVLLRMTAKAPADRYPTAREVADELAPFAVDSQLVRLLQSAGAAVTPALRPLPPGQPEDLERLTASPHETPFYMAGTIAMPAPAPRPRWLRWLAISAAVTLVCAVAGLMLFFAPALLNWVRTGWPPPPPTEEIPLPPPPGPLVKLSRLPRLTFTNLLGRDAPPTLVGFRRGDGRATGHWEPGRQQIEINPTDATLILLGADDRPAPGFTFEVSLDQRPWSGSIGVFWGYQEDAAAKAAHQPGVVFANCQALLLETGQGESGFYVERLSAQLRVNREGGVGLAQTIYSRDNLHKWSSGEKLVRIAIDGDRLKVARFDDHDLPAARQLDAKKQFQSADYQGAFGVISTSATATIRSPRVMPHEDK